MDLSERMAQVARALHQLGAANDTASDDYSDELDQAYRCGRADSYYQAARLIRTTLAEAQQEVI